MEVALIQICPEPPWENGDDEFFKGMLRREMHNINWFGVCKV